MQENGKILQSGVVGGRMSLMMSVLNHLWYANEFCIKLQTA